MLQRRALELVRPRPISFEMCSSLMGASVTQRCSTVAVHHIRHYIILIRTPSSGYALKPHAAVCHLHAVSQCVTWILPLREP